MTDKPIKRNKGGRKKIVLTDDQIELVRTLAGLQCTQAEIAAALGINQDTVTRIKQEDERFSDAIITGREFGKTSLRRMQFKNAKNGNAAMQIWLGKQILNQSDKQELDITARSHELSNEPMTDDEWSKEYSVEAPSRPTKSIN
jgi:predicted DNA-binding protein (UPF0251 family)